MLKFEELKEIVGKDFKLKDDYYVIEFFADLQKKLIYYLEERNLEKIEELREVILYFEPTDIGSIPSLDFNIENSIKFLNGEEKELKWYFNIIDEDGNLKLESLYVQDKLEDRELRYLMMDLIQSNYEFKILKAKDWRETDAFLDRNIELDKNKIENKIRDFSIKLIELVQYDRETYKTEALQKIEEMEKELETIYKYRIISNLLRTEISMRIKEIKEWLKEDKDILMWGIMYYDKEYDKIDTHYSRISVEKLKVVEFLPYKLYEIYIKNLEDIEKAEEEFEKQYQEEVGL